MKQRTKRLSAISLAALMVASMAIAGVALGAEVRRGGNQPTYDPGVGGDDRVVVSQGKPIVFRGEDDIQLVTAEGENVDAGNLIGVSGDAEGIPLEVPIPEDQVLGQYAFEGQGNQPGVTVQQPRVTDLEVFNERGVDVEGSSVPEDEILLVRGEWNFQNAEDLSIEVRDENGNDITGDVLTDEAVLSDAQIDELDGAFAAFPEQIGSPGQQGTGTDIEYLQGVGQFTDQQLNNTSVQGAYWAIDLGDQDAGTYTITVEGWDELDFGPASRTTQIQLTTESDATLELDATEATRGQYVPFTITGSSAGSTHVVTIEDDDFRNNNVDQRVFRDVENTIERGSVDTNDDGEAEFAYARVVIDEDTGLGQGQVDTTYLDDTSVDVNLYDQDQAVEEVAADFDNPEDDRTLSVQEGTLSISEPAGTYIAGQEVDVEGTAAQGVDDVALYTRDQGDWEILDINEDGQIDQDDLISVDADGVWEEDDVRLSEANDILAIPGRYRFGVVEAVDIQNQDGEIQETLTTSEFSSATSEQTSIIVTEPGLGPAPENNSAIAAPAGSVGAAPAGTQASMSPVSFQQGNQTNATDDGQQARRRGVAAQERPLVFESYNGQLATEDGTINLLGTAPGQDDVLAVMVDTRGRAATERITVDDDDIFEEDDVPLVSADGRELNEGNIEAIVIGVGRDTVAGDGVLPGQTAADLAALADYIQSISGQGLTQQQVLERIDDETIQEAGSDDLFVRDQFRYTDGDTSIQTIYPAGETGQVGIQSVAPGDTMVVAGETNRKPDDNTIAVDVTDGPSVQAFPSDSTDEWNYTGWWSVQLQVPEDAEPGLYTIEADDGDNIDTVVFEVAEPEQPAANETNVTDGNVTDGNVTDGNVTDGNVTAGNVTGGNATAAADTTSIEIRGLGENATYSFDVSGEIVSQTLDSDATVNASSATSTIVRGVDQYNVTGEITSFELDGNARVFVDGDETPVNEIGANATATNATNASVSGPLFG